MVSDDYASFSHYTLQLVYAGPGRSGVGLSRSPLFCLLRVLGVPPVEANRLLRSWLLRDDVASSWRAMIAGRRMVCDCGMGDCDLLVVRSVLTRDLGPLLPDTHRWREQVRGFLKQCQLIGDISGILIQAIESWSGGIGEMSRFLQAPTPGEDVRAAFTDQKAIAHDAHVRVDLLRLLLPRLPFCDRTWARNHSRQAKSLRARSAVDRWSYLSTLSTNYPFAGMHVFLDVAIQVAPATPGTDLESARVCASSNIQRAAERMCRDPSPLDLARIKRVMTGSRVDYFGEIVDHAHFITPEQSLPTLPSPQDGARVQLVDLIDPVEVPWISNLSLALKPWAEWPATVLRIMAARNEWEHVVSMLSRSLVAPIADSDVFQVDGQIVLNGMFGFEKPDKPLTSRGPALRLIMNFVPINSYTREVLGEVHTLPRAGQWATVVLIDGEVLVSYS